MFIIQKVFSRGTTIAATALALYLATPGVQAQTATVTAPLEAVFIPAVLRITPGTEVTWNILGPHDVVQTIGDNCEALPGGFNSGLAVPPRTFSHRFDVPGTYFYMCDPHCEDENQKGMIIVAEAEPEETDDGDETDADTDAETDADTSDGEETDTDTGNGNETDEGDETETDADTDDGEETELGTDEGEVIDPDDEPDAGSGEATETDEDTEVEATETDENTDDGTETSADTDAADGTDDVTDDVDDTEPEESTELDDGNDDSSGCSCHVPGRPVSPMAFGAFALVGLALLRRYSTRH